MNRNAYFVEDLPTKPVFLLSLRILMGNLLPLTNRAYLSHQVASTTVGGPRTLEWCTILLILSTTWCILPTMGHLFCWVWQPQKTLLIKIAGISWDLFSPTTKIQKVVRYYWDPNLPITFSGEIPTSELPPLTIFRTGNQLEISSYLPGMITLTPNWWKVDLLLFSWMMEIICLYTTLLKKDGLMKEKLHTMLDGSFLMEKILKIFFKEQSSLWWALNLVGKKGRNHIFAMFQT